jgi:hypothetical protein
MTEWLTRATPADLHIRSDGRTVVGRAVPYDRAATVNDGRGPYEESFARGAFARSIAERGGRIPFLAHHLRQAMPLGRVTLLREDDAGLMMEARVSKTVAGDEALELIRDGALGGLSVSFSALPSGERWSRDHSSVVRTEVRLREISAVSLPAYDDAVIVGVRSQGLSVDVARARLDLIRTRFR